MVKKHKRAGLSKFLVVLVIFLSYLVVSVLQFGISSGILVALLSWSFFVFCTPIADAGLLLDFPTRILTGMRMLHTEIMVWIVAVILNVTALSLSPGTYYSVFAFVATVILYAVLLKYTHIHIKVI